MSKQHRRAFVMILTGFLILWSLPVMAQIDTQFRVQSQVQPDANTIQQKLFQALKKDQQHRAEINQLKALDQAHERLQRLQAEQQLLDAANANLLESIIAELGHWPGVSDVGNNAAKVAWLLLKRSKPTQQAKFLPTMKSAATSGQIPADWYADAFDHHQMLLDQPQRYGQVLITHPQSPWPRLYPLRSIENTRQARAALKLPPLKYHLGTKNLLLRLELDTANGVIVSDAEPVMRMARLAATCLDQIYPNSIKHVMNEPNDARPPDVLHPAFFGCFDWHSSVHGHWLLVRAAKMFPRHPESQTFIDRLDAHFTAENMAAELAYFQQPGRSGYERPYGLAWYLQLYTEISTWTHPKAQQWQLHLKPLKEHIVQQLSSWIPKLAYPIRNGTHSQTAFAFSLALDYAQINNDIAFLKLVTQNINRLYLNDQQCPIQYEPSGQDFLSPCLAQADLMRRVMSTKQYSRWLKRFLPDIKKGTRWLPVAKVTDREDGKLAHLDGLNISRAWMLEGMAAGLPEKDRRRKTLARLARIHAESGLASVTGAHYAGGHWLGSFATYYLTQRGIESME